MGTIDWGDESARVWDREARRWDEHGDWWDGGPRATMLDFFCRFAGHEAVRVMDLGCGPGESTRRLTERGYDATGVDQSPQMVEAAIRRGARAVVSRCDPLPFGDGSFDAVFACTSLEWSSAPSRVVAEVHRVLRPGGAFVAVTLGPSAGPRQMGYRRLYGEAVVHNMMMPWELHQLCLEHSFTCESMVGGHAKVPQEVLDALAGDWGLQACLHFMWGFGLRR